MKKFFMLFVVIVALGATTIVKADNPFGLAPQNHGFFRPELIGKMTPAECKTAFLALFAEEPDESEIYSYFQKLPGMTTKKLKELYRTGFERRFDVDGITDFEMRKIFQKMKFRFPEDDYWKTHKSMNAPPGATTFDEMGWSSPLAVREKEQIGWVTQEGVDYDLVSTHCANQVVGCVPKKQPKKEEEEEVPEREVVYITKPGKTTYITNEPDTVFMSSSKVIIDERNNTSIVRINNRVSEVDMTETNRYAKNVSYDREESCDCDRNHFCEKHRDAYAKYYKKDKKKFLDTFGGKALIFLGGVAVGMIIENNVDFHPNRTRAKSREFIQAPLDLLPTSGRNQAGVVIVQ